VVVYLFPDIDDSRRFPSNILHGSNHPFTFYKGTVGNNNIPKSAVVNGRVISFEDFLLINNTVAYLIIKEDTIVYEKYFMGKDSSSNIPSFSMASAYTSALIGCALADGYIQSVDEPITNYLPELRLNGFDSITIKHLLQSTSGIKFKESYNDVFSDFYKLYYGNNAKKYMKDFYLMEKPGTVFRFQSGNVQLLGWILQRALKDESITHYLDRRIWFSLDPQFDGSWSLDKEQEGLEKTFCCLNAAARDFAKLGRLYLNKGMWQQKQIIPTDWVNESLIPSTSEGASEGFKYQWWLRNKNGEQAFMTTGHLGQYIYVYPSKKLIIVRLGKGYGNVNWPRLFYDYATHMD
jgi:CubicO group peptidase (beta-lactamase class C family)